MAANIRESRIVDIGESTYTLVQLKATLAYRYLSKIKDQAMNGVEMSAEDIKDLIVESTGMSKEKYELEFCGKMTSIFKLVEEIIQFNYPDVFQQGVSEEEAPKE